MIALLLSLSAFAAPCDGEYAARLLIETGLDERRAPLTHASLVPGLALSSHRATPELNEALNALCRSGAEISVALSESWETAEWSAYLVVVTASQAEGCALTQRGLRLSIAVRPGEKPSYDLVSAVPSTQMPVGDCQTATSFQDERLLAGSTSPTRLWLARIQQSEQTAASEVLVRWADPLGWHEQQLTQPAPASLLGGEGGPTFTLLQVDGQPWIVAHHALQLDGERCTTLPGQTLWVQDGGRFQTFEGAEAAGRLSRAGHWRQVTDPGWTLVVDQDVASEADLLAARGRKLQARTTLPLHQAPSALFPGFNPGFSTIIAGPFPDQATAQQAKRQIGGRQAYVKLAWPARDACLTREPSGPQ